MLYHANVVKNVITFSCACRLYLLQRAICIAYLTVFLWLFLAFAIIVGHLVLVLGAPTYDFTIFHTLAHSIACRPIAEQPCEAV